MVFLVGDEGANYVGVVLILLQSIDLFLILRNLIILLKFYRVSSGFKQIYHLLVIENKVNPRRIDTVNLDLLLDIGLEVFASRVLGALLDFATVSLFKLISVSCGHVNVKRIVTGSKIKLIILSAHLRSLVAIENNGK